MGDPVIGRPAARAVVAQHRMPEHDRERGSGRVLEVVEHLLAGGWEVLYLTLQASPDPRYERQLARLGVPTLVGTGPDVAEQLRTFDPQLAVVAFWHVAEQLVPFLRQATPAAKVVVDSIDLHFVRNLRRRADVIAAGTTWLDDDTSDELRRELDVYASADGVLTVSDGEAAVLTALAGESMLVRAVPLSERIERSPVPCDERAGILFVGNFRHLPNIEAVGYLCCEVLSRLDPDLLAAHPVTIVGNELDQRVRDAACHPNVRLVGWVPDVAPYLARARVSVAPLLHGAGVKGKVLQSLMAGTPTVVTPLALEGTDLRDREHVLVGDGAAAFARGIEALLTDDARWQAVADAGHHAVVAGHRAGPVRRRFHAAVADVLSAPPAGNDHDDSRRWSRTYARVRADVAAIVAEHVPAAASLLVVSGGDDEFLTPNVAAAGHFPADEQGHHSFHPVDGPAAVTMLEGARARGVTHLVLPSTSYWWLHTYPELATHLGDRWQLVAERDEARLWAAAPPAVPGLSVAVSPIGLTATDRTGISVVIATYDRAALLDQCLASFLDQTLPREEWEIVVIDDGSIDHTPEVLRRWAAVLPLRWARIDHAGRAVAKNTGILAAAGDLVLLFDDDDVADADLLLEHVKAHTEDPDPTVAVLGYTDFAEGTPVNPVMRFVTEVATMMFAYHEIADGDRVGWRYFWEGRLSCKRALLVEHGLHDPSLEYSVDVELGYRLSQGPGLTVVHRRSAISHMARAFTYEQFLSRMEAKGRAQQRFAELHPDPEVRAYCHLDAAASDWAAAAPTFDADRARVAALEPLVGDRPELLAELHERYLRTLRGANRRGVLEAARHRPVPPVLSIVVPVWSVTPELAEMAARTIARVRQVAQLPTEVIVVDNGSPHKVALAADTVVEHERNEGVAPAWNAGVRLASAATVVVLNSDVHVEPGWDVAMHTAANDGRRIAFPHTDHGDGLGPRRPDQAGTAGWCFALTRNLYDELGPFDESFRPAFFEDADYWTRAHAAGVELTPVTSAVVRHVRRSSARHQPDMELLFQAHRMKYSWKHRIDPTAPPAYWHRPVVEYP